MLKRILFVLLAIVSYSARSSVTVIPANQGLCLNVSPAAFLAVGNIAINENLNTDFAVVTGGTIILTAPSGFMFQPGIGSVSFTAGRNITSASVNVTLTTITVTYTVNGTNKLDAILITGISSRSTGINLQGNILRLSGSGGTANIVGDSPGGGINHGTLLSNGSSATVSTVSNGNWWAPSTWSTGKVPNCNTNVIINHAVTVDNATPVIATLTLKSGSKLVANFPVTISANLIMEANSRYVHNNNTDAATTIFNGSESIDDNSTIEVSNWSAASVPFAAAISGTIGNLIFKYNAVWDQKGLFAPSKIKGDLTVTNGQIVMDGGAGMTSLLNLKNIAVYGNGSIVFAKGANRNLTLNTTSFSDSSTSSGITCMMYDTYGTLIWNNSGDVYLKHDFSGIEGSGGYHAANYNVQIGGNLTVAGGKVDIARKINGNGTCVVTGNTTVNFITGSWFHLADYNSTDITFSTTSLNVGGAENNYLQGSAGSSVFTITGSFNYSGTSLFVFTNLYTNTANQQINIGNNFTATSGDFCFAYTGGNVYVSIANDMLISGSSTEVVGQLYPYSDSSTVMTIGRNLTLNNAMFHTAWNRGNVQLAVDGLFTHNNADFECVFHPFPGNYRECQVYIDSLNYNGGSFKLFDSYITDGKVVNVVLGNCTNINFMNASDRILFITNSTGSNNPKLNLTCNGPVTVSGNAGGQFATSMSAGNEIININGNLTLNGGVTSFGGATWLSSPSHDVVFTLNGKLTGSGGAFYQSVMGGALSTIINGQMILSGGVINLKRDDGSGKMILNGNYVQSGGRFNIHASTVASGNADTVMINGNFIQNDGIFSFDNTQAASGQAKHTLVLNSDTVVLDGNGQLTHANHLTSNTVFGELILSKNGTTVYKRKSVSHDIQQVKYIIQATTVLDIRTSPNAMLIASHSSSSPATHNTLTVNGVLELGLQQVKARQQGGYYAQVNVSPTGKIRTMHPGGFYTISGVSSIDPYIGGLNRMNYFLDSLSTVEYNGSQNQIVTGIPNGIATATQHKYGKLLINFTGISNVDYVRPQADSVVFVRTSLDLNAGEFNLNTDRVSTTSGLSINLEEGCLINRVTGYLRSEAVNGSALVRIKVNSSCNITIPFGYNSSSYIPLTYNCSSPGVAWHKFATYHTAVNNLPLPPAITHLHSIAGVDNSLMTVDRFWYVQAPSSATATIRFAFTPAEKGSLSQVFAQRWLPASLGWEAYKGTQAMITTYITQASGLTNFNGWWTLSSTSNPLPVQLLSFSAECENQKVQLQWVTATQENNDIFVVDKSTDGKKWENLTSVKGAGTNNELTTYKLLDEAPYPEISYYRLSQIDFDGKEKELKTIAVKSCRPEILQLLYASFEGSEMTLKINSSYSDNLAVFLFDNNGQMLAQKVQTIGTGINDIELHINNQSNAIYLLTLRSSYSNLSRKIIKK